MLQKIGFLPGFNKQVTSTGAESQWTGGTNVRFRYGTPEKIGGWNQLGSDKLTGAARGLHHMVNKEGIKYAAIGTNRILYVYSGEVYYDIHPLVNPSGTALTSCFTTSNGAILQGIVHGFSQLHPRCVIGTKDTLRLQVDREIPVLHYLQEGRGRPSIPLHLQRLQIVR